VLLAAGRTAHNGRTMSGGVILLVPRYGQDDLGYYHYAQQLLVSRISRGASTPPFAVSRSAAPNSRTSIGKPARRCNRPRGIGNQ
jgi:hypothetical protein